MSGVVANRAGEDHGAGRREGERQRTDDEDAETGCDDDEAGHQPRRQRSVDDA